MKEKIVKNTLYSGISSIIMGIIGFFLLPFMIAKVGVVEYGLVGISNIFAMSGYISILEMGFQSSMAVYIADYYSQKEELKICQLVNSVMIIFIVSGSVLMILGIILSDFFVTYLLKIPDIYRSSFNTMLCLIFSSYVIQFPTIALAGLFQGLQRFDILKGVQTLTVIIAALSIILLLNHGFDYTVIIISNLASFIIQFILFLLFSFKKVPFLKISHKYFSLKIIKEIFIMTKYLSIGNLSSLISIHTPRILIGLFLGPILMTSFEVVMRLPRFIKVQLGFLNSAVMTAASELKATNQNEKIRELFLRGLRYQFIIAFPVIIGAMFFAREFLRNWVGQEFENLSGLLQFVLIWNLITPIVNYGASILVGMNKELKRLMMLHVTTTAMGLILSLALIWHYELHGVIIGYAGSFILMFPWYLYIYLNEFRLKYPKFIKEIVSVIIISIIPAGIMFLTNRLMPTEGLLMLAVKGSILCLLYLCILYALILNSQDRLTIARLIPIRNLRANSKG